MHIMYADTNECVLVADEAGSKVTFDERGDGMARYTIFNYQSTPQGGHTYEVIPALASSVEMLPSQCLFDTRVKFILRVDTGKRIMYVSMPVVHLSVILKISDGANACKSLVKNWCGTAISRHGFHVS